MAIGSGLGASVGWAPETTFGTYVAATRHYPVTSFELMKQYGLVDISGVAAGRPAPPDEVITQEWGTGSMEAQVLYSKFGAWLAHIMGSTATPVQQGGTAAYLQTHPFGDNRGLSFAAQEGLPSRAGTANPYTGLGGKIMSATFACAAGEELKMNLDLWFRQISEAQSLASPSYTQPNLPFNFAQMAVKLGTYASEASVQGVTGMSATIARGQAPGFYAGNAGLSVEPIWNEFAAISGTVDIENVTKADFYDRFQGHTSTSLVWEFVGTTAIAAANFPTFRLTLPKVYFGTAGMTISGPDIIKASVPFRAFWDPTNGLATAAYMSTDTAI